MSQAPAEIASRRLVFDIRGMDCAECARSVATAVEQLPGVSTAEVNFGAGTLTVDADASAQVDLTPRVVRAVSVAGYRATTREAGNESPDRSVLADPRARLAILALVFWLAGALLSTLLDRSELGRLAYAIAILAGGWTFARAALAAVRVRRIDMNVLMTVAILGAIALGDWGEAAAAAALFAAGNLAQSLTMDRTRNALSSLWQLTPPEAIRVVDGADQLLPVELLVPGDTVRVRPGERFPTDGTIVEGASTVDESLVTGESVPSDKQVGSIVFAGTVNGPGSVQFTVTHTASESTLAQIVDMVEQARGERGAVEQTIDRFASIYTPVVVASAAIVSIAGGIVTGDWRDWITRGLVLLVIACPCALIISTPVAIVSAVGVAARRGFLVKGGAALETISSLKSVVFDKTGTLTRGQPVVDGVDASGMSHGELVRLAAAVERLSEHPLAYAIVDFAQSSGIDIPPATQFIATPGRGARASVDGAEVWIGSPIWFDELGIDFPSPVAAATRTSRTTLLVAVERVGQPVFTGTLSLTDRMRPESAEVVCSLRQMGIAPVAMMTGDNRRTADAIAREIGIDDVFAELLPGEKARLVGVLRERLGAVGMVGDGINDGPALGTATVGFAMGLTGSDLAIETADVTMLRNDLFAVPGAIDLSRQTVRIIRQNIGLSLIVKLIALALTLAGITTLWMAVAVDLGTSLLVTANALRLTRWQLPGAGHRHEPARQPGGGVAAGETTGLATGDA